MANRQPSSDNVMIVNLVSYYCASHSDIGSITYYFFLSVTMTGQDQYFPSQNSLSAEPFHANAPRQGVGAAGIDSSFCSTKLWRTRTTAGLT